MKYLFWVFECWNFGFFELSRFRVFEFSSCRVVEFPTFHLFEFLSFRGFAFSSSRVVEISSVRVIECPSCRVFEFSGFCVFAFSSFRVFEISSFQIVELCLEVGRMGRGLGSESYKHIGQSSLTHRRIQIQNFLSAPDVGPGKSFGRPFGSQCVDRSLSLVHVSTSRSKLSNLRLPGSHLGSIWSLLESFSGPPGRLRVFNVAPGAPSSFQ